MLTGSQRLTYLKPLISIGVKRRWYASFLSTFLVLVHINYWECLYTSSLRIFSKNLQATWKNLVRGQGIDSSEPVLPLPSRLVTDDDLKAFYEFMKKHDVPKDAEPPSLGGKRKRGYLGSLDTQHYGRGKRAREVCQ